MLQYINGYSDATGRIAGTGPAAFVARADELAEKYGDRFAPGPLLRKKAENGELFR